MNMGSEGVQPAQSTFLDSSQALCLYSFGCATVWTMGGMFQPRVVLHKDRFATFSSLCSAGPMQDFRSSAQYHPPLYFPISQSWLLGWT